MGINRRLEVPSIWRVPSGRLNHRYLATFFNLEIRGLSDSFLIKIKENVNPWAGKWQVYKLQN